MDVIQNHSRHGDDKPRSMSPQSLSTFSASTNDYQSTISRGSFAAGSNQQDGEARADSPSIPNAPEPGQTQGQMQSLSGTLAGSGGNRPDPGRRTSDQVTPVSPPTAGDSPGEDYITARAAMVSPLRRSVFHENEEDLGKQ